METTLTYLLCSGGAIWIAGVLRRLASTTSGPSPGYAVPCTTIQSYRAFQRLFSSREKAFLDEHPSVAKQLGRRLGRNRREVFQIYLEQLKGEQSIVSRQLRDLAVQLDRPDLVREAIWRDVGFTSCYWMLRLQIALGLPVTPRSLGWVGVPKAKPVTVADIGPAYAEMERTAVR